MLERTASFEVGRWNSLLVELVMVTTRTTPSAPGWTFVILTIFHWRDGVLSSFKIANEPTLTLSFFVSQHPLL